MAVELQKVKRDEKEEHEHHHDHHEEFELVPVSPLRRMEKRIDDLEKSHATFDVKEFYREMVDIIRMNQQLVDELAKANDALRIELSRLPARIEELVDKMKELLSYIKAAATEEQTGMTASGQAIAEGMQPLAKRLDVLIDTNKKIVENNQALLNVLEEMDNKLRNRGTMLPPTLQKPMPPSNSPSQPAPIKS